MGLFKKIFNNTPTAEEKLSTGELNWRLKPTIAAVNNFPNYSKFIRKLEDDNEIQFGLHNEVSNENQKTLALRQVIYDKSGKATFTFLLIFLNVPLLGIISFSGIITNFYELEELLNPDEKYFVSLNTHRQDDLDVSEYEKYYWELLNQCLSIKGLSPKEYLIKGKKCVYKIMEQNVREKYK